MTQRDETIDVLKGMLVFGMVLSHVAGLVSSYAAFPIKQIWLFTGLVTFSGFVFSFGYACQIAYFSKDLKAVYRRIVSTALKPLIAFYISGMYWRAFVDKQLDFAAIANILLLNDIPPFSEFLVSFSLIILVSLLLFKPIQKLTSNPKHFWILFALLLLTTFLPYAKVHISQVGLLIGTTQFPTYPVLQYFPIYLLGIYFAKHKILYHRQTLVISALGIGLFLFSHFVNRQIPSRFPPSLSWILASLFFVYLYYLAAQRISKWNFVAPLLSSFGKNVLFYLLLSNIMIFTFRGAYAPLSLPPLASLGMTVLVLLTIHFLIQIVSSPNRFPSINPAPIVPIDPYSLSTHQSSTRSSLASTHYPLSTGARDEKR
jgi:fucose 4-O-acetylase-like acetyltransferase